MARPNLATIFTADDNMSPVVRRMGDQVESYGKKVQSVSKASSMGFGLLKTAAVSALAVFGVSQIKDQIASFSAYGDEIAKTSSRLGLTSEALQKLRYAAGQQGVANEELDAGFATLNANLGKLAVGSGKLTKFLEKSNPELLRQLRGAKDNNQAFRLLINTINNTSNVSQRAALATMAFGGAGEKMILMAKGGTQTLDELGLAAEKYGILSNEAAAESEKLNDAQDNLNKSLTGLKNGALAPLLLSLTPIIQSMADWISANRELISSNIQAFIQGITSVLTVFVDLWNSGVIQTLTVGIATFKAVEMGIYAYNTAMAIAKVGTLQFLGAWLATNAAFLATPIGAVIAGVLLLVGAAYLLYRNFEKVWEWVTNLSTPMKVLGAIMMLAFWPITAPILAITAAIYAMVKAYQWAKAKLSGGSVEQTNLAPPPAMPSGTSVPANFTPPSSALASSSTASSFTPPSIPSSQGLQSPGGNTMSPMATPVVSQSKLTIDFVNMPEWAKVDQKIKAPNITINTGFQGSKP